MYLHKVQSTCDKPRGLKSRTRDKSRTFCPVHPKNEKITFGNIEMLESPLFFHFFLENQEIIAEIYITKLLNFAHGLP